MILEEEKRVQDAKADRNYHDRVLGNWKEHKVLCTKFYSKIELNLRSNKTRTYVHDNLLGMSLEAFVERLMENIGQCRKFGCLCNV